jgi:hypothetical protein
VLALLIAAFAPAGPLVVGIDEMIERRRGKKIGAAGIYRDPERSSHSHFVKVPSFRSFGWTTQWFATAVREGVRSGGAAR